MKVFYSNEFLIDGCDSPSSIFSDFSLDSQPTSVHSIRLYQSRDPYHHRDHIILDLILNVKFIISFVHVSLFILHMFLLKQKK